VISVFSINDQHQHQRSASTIIDQPSASTPAISIISSNSNINDQLQPQ
jgi:hypothetical protein